jgi:transcriptional regulator with PAS, ATPase and Fis domain
VSRRHARLEVKGSTIEVTDLDSTNGTFVRGMSIKGAEVARPGDVVRFGEHCTFLVVDDLSRYERWWEAGTEGPIIGGAAMGAVRDRVKRFAKLPNSVLVTGETGTGKEVVSQALHTMSGRRGRFIGVNLAAVPEGLFESELFGYKRGAHASATSDRDGKLRLAHLGTILLDEVGELDIKLQSKLLRVLQEKEVWPLGATRSEPADVRVVAATNRDLTNAVESGGFRQDLYYRLRALRIELQPLRERREDVVLLASHFLNTLDELKELGVRELSTSAVTALVQHDWPGNVRELIQVLVEAAVKASDLGDRVIRASHLSSEVDVNSPAGPADGEVDLRQSEVFAVLRKHDGNVSHAAEEVGLHRAQIYRILSKARKKAADFRDD